MITDKDGNTLHLEDNQSEDTFRPTFLIPGKENEDLVRIVVERMDKEAQENQIISLKFGDVTVKINICFHPAGDGKAGQTATGLGGK